MNIVHLQLSGGIGGISILTRDIANISKHNNIFYFLFEGGIIADEMEQNGSTVKTVNDKSSSFSDSAKHFLTFCREQKADVIICHSGAPVTRFIFSYIKKHYKNAKYILYLHSNASLNVYNNKTKEILNRYLTQKAHKSCDKAVAISQSVKDSFCEIYNFNANKIKVVYNGIDCKKFYSEKLDSSDKTLSIIYVGRVFAAKGIHILIDAIGMCKNKNNMKLTIVGRDHGGYTEKMKKKADELGLNDIITFMGARTDIPELLAQNDVFIHPALCEEGFGITLAEAMAAYLPCIAFNKGAIPEIIDNDKNGFIVEQADAEHLAQAIDKVYDCHNTEQYKEMRIRARKKAEVFSIENVVKELEELYY